MLEGRLRYGRPGIYSKGFYPTTANMDIYVNAATGDDDTGDGSSGSPYATITRAWEDVPEVVAHRVRILISSGTYTAFPTLVSPTCIELGSVSFIGVGAPTEVVAEFTLSDKSNLGNGGHTLTYSGAGWTANAYTGLFVEVTSGAASGSALPILSNTTDTLRIPKRDDSVVPASGDDVRIVKPSVVIQCTRFTVRQMGELVWDPSWGSTSLQFLNLEFDVSSSDVGTIAIKEGSFAFQFVSVRANDSTYDTIEIQGASINRQAMLDSGAAALTGTGFTNFGQWYGYGPGFTHRRVTAGPSTCAALTVGYPRGSHAEVAEFTALDSIQAMGYTEFVNCGFRRTHIVSSEGYCTHTLYDIAGANDGAGGYSNSRLWLSSCYFMGAVQASIQVAFKAVIYDCDHDPSTPYGATVWANNDVIIDQDSASGLAGDTADILFLLTGGTGTWPAEGEQETDGKGASVVGVP